jgi:hypothetical protein
LGDYTYKWFCTQTLYALPVPAAAHQLDDADDDAHINERK